MDTDDFDNDDNYFRNYLDDPGSYGDFSTETDPSDVIQRIRSGEILAEPNFRDEETEHEAKLALDAFLELLRDRELTVASEFLFYFAPRNFAFCKMVAGLLEKKVKPKGGRRISEDDLLEMQRRFDDPAIAHLPIYKRREIAGAPYNIQPRAVGKRQEGAQELFELHKIKDVAAQAELDVYLEPPETDPNQPSWDVFRKI